MTELITLEELKQLAAKLKLHGLLAHWDELNEEEMPLIKTWLHWEETEGKKRGLERRLGQAHLGRFKPLSDFDWSWLEHGDKDTVSDMMQLDFIQEATNIILMGPNGVGKSTIAQNIAYQAVIQGHTAVFVEASQMLGDLAAQDGDNALRRRIKRYVQPAVLVIDEVGYLSYGTRHADLLFEIISRRYEVKPTVITTNKPFSEWGEVFPSASCVVSLVDRLIHHSEIIVLEGESYRMKEAQERAQEKKQALKAKRRPRPTKK
jgi:DNA replication protein DnaC